MSNDLKKYVEVVKALHSEGKSKAQVTDVLAESMSEDFGAAKAYGLIPKVIKDAGVKFRKGKGTTWRDLSAQAFAENPELSKDEMRAIVDEAGMKDPDWYVNAWHHIFATIAKGSS